MRKRCFEYFCDDIENVENYEKAKADNFVGWECHHKLETHTSDGERRLVDLTKKELIALDMYLHRPANELTFLTKVEHVKLHHKGKHHSEEWKRKCSDAMKCNKNAKGHTMSAETKMRISEANKGMHWKLVDGKRVWY